MSKGTLSGVWILQGNGDWVDLIWNFDWTDEVRDCSDILGFDTNSECPEYGDDPSENHAGFELMRIVHASRFGCHDDNVLHHDAIQYLCIYLHRACLHCSGFLIEIR